MLNLNELVLSSDLPLDRKLSVVFLPPYYLADGLADYLAEEEHIPPLAWYTRDFSLRKPRSFFTEGGVCIQIPSVGLSRVSIPESTIYWNNLFMLHGDQQTRPAFWKEKSERDSFLAREEPLEGKVFTIDLYLRFFGKYAAFHPHILRVHHHPINPNDLQRLEREVLGRLVPQYG